MRRQLLRQCLRSKEKKGRLACSTISRALQAVMSSGYVPRYTERSLSRRCIFPDAARPGRLTYKMVSVFQLYRDKLWIIGMNAKQLVDYSTSSFFEYLKNIIVSFVIPFVLASFLAILFLSFTKGDAEYCRQPYKNQSKQITLLKKIYIIKKFF